MTVSAVIGRSVIPVSSSLSFSRNPLFLPCRQKPDTLEEPVTTPIPKSPPLKAALGKQKEILITDPKFPLTVGVEEPRTVHVNGLFSVSTTTSKAPYLIKDEIERILGHYKIKFSGAGYELLCSHKPQILPGSDLPDAGQEVKFEISVVKLFMVGLHGVVFKKVSGDAWRYKEICQTILKDLRL